MAKFYHKKHRLQKGLKVRMSIFQTQAEIERMYIQEKLSPSQIAIKRGTSTQAVYKILSKIKKKAQQNQGVAKPTPSHQPPRPIRGHGFQWKINILWHGEAYEKTLHRCNQVSNSAYTVKLWKHEIELYCHLDFSELTPEAVTREAFQWFNKIIPYLENDLKLVLMKPRATNIKLVLAHYAETNNELSRKYHYDGNIIKCYTKEDGKCWFLFDFSKKNYEAEAIHPETAQKDMGKVVDFFNDVRDNPHYSPSETKGILDTVLGVQQQYATLIQRHLIVQEETLKALKSIKHAASQRSLKGWF